MFSYLQVGNFCGIHFLRRKVSNKFTNNKIFLDFNFWPQGIHNILTEQLFLQFLRSIVFFLKTHLLRTSSIDAFEFDFFRINQPSKIGKYKEFHAISFEIYLLSLIPCYFFCLDQKSNLKLPNIHTRKIILSELSIKYF